MKITKFLIQFEFDPERTRWITNDQDFVQMLEYCARAAADSVTVGQCPNAMVSREETHLNWQHVQAQ
jgi:hypothetical protein